MKIRCQPNAFLSWNPEKRLVMLHATEPISLGEEITISYVQDCPYLLRDERAIVLAE